METYNGITAFYADSRKAWRAWLEKNHETEKAVWLIIFKKESNTPSVYYPEAVDEALCFGWIDSKPNKRDSNSYYQFFARRSPKSNWSRVNKLKVEKLVAQGLMTEAGFKIIELARQNGTWTALDEVENITIPADLQACLSKNNAALTHWEAFPRSAKRGILEWIMNAKKAETRQKRIEETVLLAAQNKRANYPQS